MSQLDAVSLVLGIPDEYLKLLRGVNRSKRHPALSWSVVEYVCHAGDNLRIWAEPLAGIARGATNTVPAYDENLLARVRQYDGIALEGALWPLERAVGDWDEAVKMATRKQVVLVHLERGEQTVLDVVRSNAHDANHHKWDIERSL